ncbi:PilZ domain-containing protein [Methylomonas rapida]|uniref:PilZ domain-containing protein n=1 Tax=Methylomonas rapida TaxID=2963939 RepID=A0ABY7GRC5_9GAMM|nr:PilZ domain-containing protein [Methylomonas rapida]WAR47064.1 PilZ domain-containing protein [Methylomonas rapida]
MTDHRRHQRLLHRARIKVTIPSLSKQFETDMRDFSESGLFLLYPKDLGLEKGAIVEVQTLEFEDAPIQSCKVVRIEPGIGIAVEFV